MKKAVLVTGASSGIGRATAKLFAQRGYFVYLMGRNKQGLEETALDCSHGAALLSCDLTDPQAVEKRLEEILHNPHYRLEVLVNNAGAFVQSSLQETSDEVWSSQFEVNLLSAVRLTRLLTPYFLTHKKGSIVNVSSTLGLKPTPHTGAYSAVKAAMISWTINLAQELGPFIRANVVCPGIVDTPIHSFHSLKASEKSKVESQLAELQPLHRIGKPEEIAESIYFLGSDLSSWTTGAVLSVDGGINVK